jgi:hypoxanthine phosphoribosyltransferase
MENQEQIRCHMVSWGEARNLGEILALKIKISGFEPDIIIGIARGGLVPARILCDLLLKKQLLSITVEHWGIAKTTGKAVVKIPLSFDISGKKVLVVDDVADTGDTYVQTLNYLEGCDTKDVRTAAMHYKTSSTFIPDYWGEMQEDWKWIIYPWEVYEGLNEFILKELSHKMILPEIKNGLWKDFELDIKENELEKMLKFMELDNKIRTITTGNDTYWEVNKSK